MVSTSELTVAVSTDTVGLVCFCFFFFLASLVWVATIVDVAQEVDIFPSPAAVR
jgi:hypothetical protein